MKAYTPRKKKVHKIIVKTHLVRIDHKTQIEVPLIVSDDQARERYLSRLNIPIKGKYVRLLPNTPNLPVKHEFKDEEVVIEDLEEVPAVVADPQEE